MVMTSLRMLKNAHSIQVQGTFAAATGWRGVDLYLESSGFCRDLRQPSDAYPGIRSAFCIFSCGDPGDPIAPH